MKIQIIFRSIVYTISFILIPYVLTNAQTTIVKGKLLDVNRKPSKFALVGVASSVHSNEQFYVKCDEKGNYSIKITTPGQNFLVYSIPSHEALRIPVQNIKDKEFKINVTLAPYKYKDSFDNVCVDGTFNNFNIASPEKMKKEKDGTYTYEVTTDEKEIKYQLCDIEKNGRTINAPGSSTYKPDYSGDYYSVLKVTGGKTKIVFDPSKLLRRNVESKVSFTGSKYDETIYKLNNEFSKITKDAYQKMHDYVNEKKDIQNFQYDRGDYFSALLKKIDSVKDNNLKNYLKLNYVSFASVKPKGYNYEKAETFFNSIPPGNYAWEMVPSAFYSYYSIFPKFKWNELQDKFLRKSKSMTLKIGILGNKLSMAKYANDTEELKKIHALILNNFKDVKEAQDLLKRYPVESKIKVGAEIPDFNVTSLDSPNLKYSKQGMIGKIYLIDFWATWCGPCVREMGSLHKAYEKFKDKGFDILSLSLDNSPDVVTKFRNEKWKMPWKNSFIGRSDKNKLTKKFEVTGIPKPILVGKDGKILAMNGKLRGSELEKTLSKYFNSKISKSNK
jgi:thiol-disulfide isomerase/thioredoxin